MDGLLSRGLEGLLSRDMEGLERALSSGVSICETPNLIWKDGGAAGIDRTLKYKISDSSGGSPEAEQINAASTTTTHYTQPPPQPSASKCNQRGFYMLANADTAVLLTTERVAHPCSHVRKQMPLPSPTGLAAPPPWAMGPLGNILRRLSIHRTQGLDLGSIYLVNLVIS